ncbi:MAG: bifunctional diaminohydroxyphosphoribosylaminopyrimidine deaminase/5-amino-6-(5-phosphoribosylamino)uracil reductase RibD [Verrucomicrobiae bacterium]|nr:bifunctional diaminohydroxyphosphoribosylaminopyrimidine deaminase/5-amino-6-(5-phosphoribosylamino)uracil reductase RibD [Verrucomicrobiae bacterium]
MRRALRLARRGYGKTSPNPMVGAVLVRNGRLLGEGWHRKAGGPHAEVEAVADARRRGERIRGATIYVTLEPCSTHGRTPPCTDAIQTAGIRHVVVAATDPNPAHAGRGLDLLRAAGINVEAGLLAEEATRLNEAFNHWIVHRTPFITLKVAMSLDGKIATATGESKWITSPESRRHAMRLRAGADAILVGVNTVLVDDPTLSLRHGKREQCPYRRIVLDSRARTPLTSRLVGDAFAERTLIVTTDRAPAKRLRALQQRVEVLVAPTQDGRVDLMWLMSTLGKCDITHLFVEGGGEVHGAFLEAGLAHRLAAFYAPMIIGGREAPKAVGGQGAGSWDDIPRLEQVESRRIGPDLFLTGRLVSSPRPDDCPNVQGVAPAVENGQDNASLRFLDEVDDVL